MKRAAIAVAVALARIAHADEKPLADQKFDQAQKLRADGDAAGACRLFRESLMLNPNAIGTVLNVARCDEEAGKLASAYRRFADALARAIEQGSGPQRDAAEQHMKALVDRIPHLSLSFVAPPPQNALIAIDGATVAQNAASDIMVDPGRVHIVVSAPGYVSFEAYVTIAESERKTQIILKLVPPIVVKRTRRFVGKILTYVGGGVAVAGLGIAVGAKVDYNATHDGTTEVNGMAKPNCVSQMGKTICVPDKANRLNADHTLGNIATGVGVAGLAVGVAGLAMWLMPYQERHPVAIVPELGPGQAGLAAAWRF